MTRIFVTCAAAAFIVGCSGAAEEEADGIEAGEWEITVRPVSVEAADAPPEALAAMEAQLQAQPPQTMTECFSEEEADNFATELGRFSGNEQCQVSESNVGDGTISISADCTVPGAEGSSPMTMEGSYDRTSMQTDIALDMTAGPLGDVTMNMEMTGERTGECSG